MALGPWPLTLVGVPMGLRAALRPDPAWFLAASRQEHFGWKSQKPDPVGKGDRGVGRLKSQEAGEGPSGPCWVSALPASLLSPPSPTMVPVAAAPGANGGRGVGDEGPHPGESSPPRRCLWRGPGCSQDCGLLPTRPWFNTRAALQRREAGGKDTRRCHGPPGGSPSPADRGGPPWKDVVPRAQDPRGQGGI